MAINVKLKGNSTIPVDMSTNNTDIQMSNSCEVAHKILHSEIVAETHRAEGVEANLQYQINRKQDLGYIALDRYLMNPDCGEITDPIELGRLNTYLVNKVSINASIYYLTLSNRDVLIYFCTSKVVRYNQITLTRSNGRFQLTNVEVGTTYHNELHNLDFEHSGHTGFAGIKIGTKQEWDRQPTYVPDRGVIIVYTDGENGKPAIKVGSGNNYLVDLAFVNEGIADILNEHILNNEIHITQEERERWNHKINVVDTPSDGLLVLNRN